MECTVVFRCECNNKTYPSKQALSQHRKTKGHQSWQEKSELRDLKVELTHRDNEILRLKNAVNLLKELNTTLIKRLSVENVS